MLSCTRCILTEQDAPDIQLNKDGICNYCETLEKQTTRLGGKEQRLEALRAKVSEIKQAGKGKSYDCLLGVSGGTDSTYMAWWAKQEGLRPLVIHFDNGWNSELAVKNIEQVCQKLGFELHTYVIDWEEFRDMQLAYLRAGVVDIEVLTDHAIYAVVYDLAKKYKVKYSLNGYNYNTESIMPKGWTYNKRDWSNIKDICQKFSDGIKFKTFPHITFWKSLYYYWVLQLESVYVLNYLEYDKKEAQEIITRELGWRDYGGKHFESTFTKFYQSYILPTKFGIDKRRAHLANLVSSGQIVREQALEELQKPLYTEKELRIEKEFVLKKLKLKEEEFDAIMQAPVRKHEEFASDTRLWEWYFRWINRLKFRRNT